MILMDIYDTASWWTLVIAAQVVVGLTYFMKMRKSKKPEDRLTQQKLLEWKPLPLVPDDLTVPEPPLMGKINEKALNLGATSFLCLDQEPKIMERAIQALHKYGVGSCGPRGFYGTIDVHLELEERLAKFLQVEETCVYSYGFSTVASAIPAYAKKGDIIFADEKVWFAIQKGIDASRSTVRYFRHNDMQDLERQLELAAWKKELNPKRRAFLVAEAIYLNTGYMCPLRKLVELARRFKLRIILDESLSIGVIGKTGRGLTEHLNVPRDEIDLIVGSLEHSFASIGGFCAGSHYIVEHQRLSGSCPRGRIAHSSRRETDVERGGRLCLFVARSALTLALQALNERLRASALYSLYHFSFSGDVYSPVKHLYTKDEGNVLSYDIKMEFLRNIAKYCMERGVAVTVSAHIKDDELSCPEPSIRIVSTLKLNDVLIAQICEVLDKAYIDCKILG
ncbi:jg15796 [Pararge aegeria aegeria]|uniref:Serine palmitoyltransferase 1 n=1 Tax=Pararge aegeria aegeria TaxID=348720 RepID=A0A8S4RCM4_9NEOP|nr:jg15796 [Pararge aegeria aegeria]